jgi:hypothetical protein
MAASWWRLGRRLQCEGAGHVRQTLHGLRVTALALVAQRIEHRPPEPVAQVRVLPGAQNFSRPQEETGPENASQRGPQSVLTSQRKSPFAE